MRESVKLKFFMGFLLCCCWAWPVQAAPLPNVKNLHLSYSLYVGGIHAMDGVVGFTRAGVSYTINLHTGTQGFLRSLAPWDASLESKGRFSKAQLYPSVGNVLTYWKDKPYLVNFSFAKNTVKVKFTPREGDNNEPVPPDMKVGALDPLSGVLQVISNIAYNGSDCNQTVPIYDGHRRFDLSLHNSGSETLDGEDYSVFSGEATRCIVDFEMRAGSRKDREGSNFWQDGTDHNSPGHHETWKGKSSRPPVYIFLGKVRDDLPELPVRAETSTIFGGIMIHLTKVEGGNGPTLTIP